MLTPCRKTLSHVGMIIQSTTLDTEAKVIDKYGGAHWIQHSGYMLRGASSGVVANSAVKTNGEDTHTLTVAEMPKHNHQETSMYAFNNSPSQGNVNISCGGKYLNYLSDTSANWTMETGSTQPHNNVPNYKSVYIWERTA